MFTINVDSATSPTHLPAYQRQMLTAKLLIMHFAMVGFRKIGSCEDHLP